MTRILALALVVLTFAAAPAAADPLTAAIGALIGKAAAAWAAIGTGALGLAIKQTLLGLAVSKISQMLRRPAPPPGVRRRVDFGGDKPQRVLLGWYASPGHLIYAGSHGADGKTPNAYYTEVLLLSVLPVHRLTGILVNGAKATLGTVAHPDYGYPVTDFRKGAQDYLWIKFYSGDQTSVDPMLVAKYGGAPDFPWAANMIGRGTAYAIITTRGNQELWSGQPPQVLFEVEGARLYDQRADSTMGGSGAQRLDDPATWAWSCNPIAAAQTILTAGLSWQGQHLYGPRWPRHMLPAANVAAALNACDLPVPGQDGTPEPSYRFGADLDLSTDPHACISELLAACGGDSAFCENRFLVQVGPAGAPVAHITDTDCSIDHPQELDPFKGRQEVFNAASSTFNDPAQGWVSAPAPARYHPEWEAEDGGRRVARLQYPLVPWVAQVQRLDEAALRNQRKGRVHRIVLSPRFAHLATLDFIAWTSARNNYAAKLFKIHLARDYPSGFIEVLIGEDDPDDYDPPSLLPHDPVPPTRIEIAPQAVPGFMVLPWTGKDADGIKRRAGARIVWDASAFEDVQLLRLVARLDGDTGEGFAIPVADIARGERIVQDPLIPGQTYQFNARLIAGRPTEWAGWQSVLVPDVRLGWSDFDEDVGAQIAGRVDEAVEGAIADLDIRDIKAHDTLPPAGYPNQIVVKTPEMLLYRWDDATETWSTRLFAGIPDDAIGASNLVPNSGFLNTSSLGWALYNNGGAGGSLGFLDDDSIFGRWAVITAGATPGSTLGVYKHPTLGSAIPGGYKAGFDYVISWWAVAPAGNAAIGKLMEQRWNSPSPSAVEWIERPALSTVPQRYAARVRFSTDKAGELYITLSWPWPAGAIVRISQVQVEQGSVLTGYAPRVGEIVPGSIGSTHMAVGSVLAEHVASRILTAQHLYLGDMSNMVPEWTDRGTDGWTRHAGFQSYAYNASVGGWTYVSNGRDQIMAQNRVAVTPGETFYFSAWVYNSAPERANLYLVLYNLAGNSFSWPSPGGTDVKNAWTKVEGLYTVPAGVSYIQFFLLVAKAAAGGLNTHWSKPVMRRATDNALVVNGSITGLKIAGQTITGDLVAASTLTGNKFVANTITGNLLATTGLITVSAQIANGLINNAHISGAIQSTNFVSGSTGWQINKNGTAQFNNLIVRGSLVIGSVSDIEQVTLPNEYNRHGTSWNSAGAVTLPAVSATDMWFIHASASLRGATGWVAAGGGESGYSTSMQTGFRLMRRYQIDGTWQGWGQIASAFSSTNQTIWQPVSFNEVMAGDYTAVQYQIETIVSGSGGAPISNINARRLALVARKITR